MVLDPRKRQKKKERQNSKQRAKQKALVREAALGIAQRLQQAAQAPILDCCTTDVLWQQGMAQLLISRRLPNGQVAFSVFLLDLYCLGVKDAFCRVESLYSYEALRARVLQQGRRVDLSPACARKLIEGAIAYADELGILPHPDYRKARYIWGQIDPAECSRTFEYGKDGKPCFIAGPHDSSARCRQIIGKLQQHFGQAEFDYVLPLAPGDTDGLRMISGIPASDELAYLEDDQGDEEP